MNDRYVRRKIDIFLYLKRFFVSPGYHKFFLFSKKKDVGKSYKIYWFIGFAAIFSFMQINSFFSALIHNLLWAGLNRKLFHKPNFIFNGSDTFLKCYNKSTKGFSIWFIVRINLRVINSIYMRFRSSLNNLSY